MKNPLSASAAGQATGLFLAISYTLCVACCLVFPEHKLYLSWQKLLPGFTWLSWPGFFLGLLESYAYGWYFALIWVPLYNFFLRSGRLPWFRSSPSAPLPPGCVCRPVCRCPVHPDIGSSYPGYCPECARPMEKKPEYVLASREYTCPMHPEIVRPQPGNCPICGMTLEPRKTITETANEEAPELLMMSRRFRIGLLLGLPVVVLAMLHDLAPMAFPAWLTGRRLQWIELILATPVVWWAGWPFSVHLQRSRCPGGSRRAVSVPWDLAVPHHRRRGDEPEFRLCGAERTETASVSTLTRR